MPVTVDRAEDRYVMERVIEMLKAELPPVSEVPKLVQRARDEYRARN